MKLLIKDLNINQKGVWDSITKTPASEVKHHVIRGGRGSGKTHIIIRLIPKFVSERNNQEGIVVSGSVKQFKRLWKLTLELAPDIIREVHAGLDTIEYINGTTVQFYTAANYESIMGNHVDFLICDETALFPLHALDYITPIIDKRKKAKGVFVSIPYGKNDFYYMCMRGMDNKEDPFITKHYKLSYLDMGEDYDVKSVEAKRKSMVDSIFQSQYLGEFVFGTSSVFGEFKKYQLIKEWIDPIKGELYYGAVDWSGAGEDSTILLIENEKGEICFIHECLSGNIPEQVDELAPHINRYNNAFIKSEVNGLGLGGTEMLQLKCNNVFKFWMSNKTKNDIVSRAKKALFNKTLILPSVDLYPKLDNEMTSYIVTRTNTGLLTYKHEKELHDDTVDAMLIANYTKELFMQGIIGDPEQNPEIKENYWEGVDMKKIQDEEYDPEYDDPEYDDD